MKTPRPESRPEASRTDRSSHAVRRRRTLAAFDCESLEGRKLMTGFAGAPGTMSYDHADLGGMNGADQGGMGDFHRFDRGMGEFDGSGADQGSASSDAQSTTSSSTPAQGFGPDDLMGRRGGGDRSFAGSGMGDGSGPGGMASMPFDRGGPGNFGGRGDSGGQGADNTQLQTDLTKLQTDEQAIHDKSQVTPALLAAVRKDNQAIDAAKTGTADATAEKTLQTDQQTIFGGLTDGARPTDAQQATLQADRDAVLTSQGVSQALITQLATDQAAVKAASNFTSADQATLDADHAAIQADLAAGTTTTSTPTAASTPSTAAATPAAATATTTTTTAAATPDATATAATAATPGAATPAGTTDPTATQVTSTAAPMAATATGTTVAHAHHGRANLDGRGGMGHEGGAGGQATGMLRGAGGFSRREGMNR